MNEHINKLPPKVILWGGTGQAKESRPIIEYYGAKVIAVFDDTPYLKSPFSGVPIYHGWEQFMTWITSQNRAEIGFCIAIGNPHGRTRLRLQEELIKVGLLPVSIAHASAVIAGDAIIGVGCQIMAGAVIDSDVRIGQQCIVNINSVVGHDNIMEDGSEVGPGVTVCGSVHIGVNAWVGAGSTVYPKLKIGADAIVGIGSVVIRNVEKGTTVLGNPAKVLWKREMHDSQEVK
jgi:sugar O-acyltransferase (sialic acid O-acetyltransferase NeuD family)